MMSTLADQVAALADEMETAVEYGTMPGVRMRVRQEWAARFRALLDARCEGLAPFHCGNPDCPVHGTPAVAERVAVALCAKHQPLSPTRQPCAACSGEADTLLDAHEPGARVEAGDLQAAIARVEESRQTHIEWRDHWRAYAVHSCEVTPCPWESARDIETAIAGDMEHQERAIAGYDNVLAVLRSMPERVWDEAVRAVTGVDPAAIHNPYSHPDSPPAPAAAEGTDERCPVAWCAYPMPHEHSSTAARAITDWQAVAERTLHGVGQWKRRYEAERAENEAWRDALRLRTADREFLDAALFEGNLTWAVGEVARRILYARPAGAEGTDVEARVWDEALRWVRQQAGVTSPEYVIDRIDRAEPFNPYRAQRDATPGD